MAFEHLCTGASRVLRSTLTGGFLLFLALVSSLVGCKSSKKTAAAASAASVALAGKVTYIRIPLVTDANGVPTGLETNPANFKVLPLRGVQVLAFQGTNETNPDGTTTKVWKKVTGSVTDSVGAYSMTVESGKDTYVEVHSVFQAGNLIVRVIADPNGVNSSLPQAERVVYSARKGADGTSPAGNPTPGTLISGNAIVNFDLGLTDPFWLAPSNDLQPTSAVLESNGTGSRPFAIGDTIGSFSYAYIVTGGVASLTLDWHYRPGVAETRGSFIEFDRSKYPLAFSPSENTSHFFGSLKGSTMDDDAWDEGVILPLFSRFYLFSQGQTSFFPPSAPLVDLSPDVAVIEGLAPAMAANLLKSPYLADTSAGGIHVSDIRDITSLTPAKQTVYSAPNLRALAWELVLKANGIASPGTSAAWNLINPNAMDRFFLLISPSDRTDVSNSYLQLARLKEAKTATEPVDLAAIFTDATLTSITAPFNITWPRPTTPPLNSFVTDWGADPNTTSLTPMPISMANAVAVQGVYPNLSEGEVAFARFTLSKDTAYNLRVVSSSSALPAGSHLQISFPTYGLTYSFSGDPSSATARVIFAGNATTPVVYPVVLQLVSPNTTVPAFTASVQMAIAN